MMALFLMALWFKFMVESLSVFDDMNNKQEQRDYSVQLFVVDAIKIFRKILCGPLFYTNIQINPLKSTYKRQAVLPSWSTCYQCALYNLVLYSFWWCRCIVVHFDGTPLIIIFALVAHNYLNNDNDFLSTGQWQSSFPAQSRAVQKCSVQAFL